MGDVATQGDAQPTHKLSKNKPKKLVETVDNSKDLKACEAVIFNDKWKEVFPLTQMFWPEGCVCNPYNGFSLTGKKSGKLCLDHSSGIRPEDTDLH